MITLKRFILPAIILGVGTIAILAIISTKATPNANPDKLAEPPLTEVAVQKAIKQTVTLTAQSQGSVKPKREIDIVAQVSGQIVNVTPLFVNGSFIDKNEILIELDDRDYQAALLTAQARLLQAERLLAEEKGRSRQAKKEWRDLGNQEANDLFLRAPQLAEAQASVKSAKANITVAKLNIERTKIRLPFNARIIETLVNLGQFVGVGTKIARVYDTSIAEVKLPLSDKQMALLDLPAFNSKLENQPQVTLTGTVAGKQQKWQGKITRTESAIDIRTRMYFAIAEVEEPFKNKNAPLLPGLFVEAEIAGKQLSNVLVLPKTTLVNRNNLYTLNSDNKIELTPVNVLKKQGDSVWLQADLAENTYILLEKHAVVAPGLTITPTYSTPDNKVNPIKNTVATMADK